MPLVNLGVSSNYDAWLRSGGRGIDTAYAYGKKRLISVGTALRKSTLPRSRVFLTSKLPCCPARFQCGPESKGWWFWPPVSNHGKTVKSYESLRELVETDLMLFAEYSLKELQTDYVDLMLLHFPCESNEQSLRAYRVLEILQRTGKARAIGVANFNATQLEMLTASASIRPSVNQFGYSLGRPSTPWFDDAKLVLEKTRKLGITPVAYGALGSSTHQGIHSIVTNPKVNKVASSLHVSAAQVALRWLAQQRIPFVTAGSSPEHFVEDVATVRFELDAHHMLLLSSAHF